MNKYQDSRRNISAGRIALVSLFLLLLSGVAACDSQPTAVASLQPSVDLSLPTHTLAPPTSILLPPSETPSPTGTHTHTSTPTDIAYEPIEWYSNVQIIDWPQDIFLYGMKKLIIDPHDPAKLYAVMKSGYLAISQQGGYEWQALPVEIQTANSRIKGDEISDLTIDFNQDPPVMYIGTWSSGVARSLDAGKTWEVIYPGSMVGVVAVHPANPSILFASTDTYDGEAEAWVSSLVRSSDGCITWTQVNNGLGTEANQLVVQMVFDLSDPDTIYAATNGSGVYKSVDGGLNWTPSSQGLTNLITFYLLIDPINPQVLYAGTPDHGIFKSTDGAATWQAINTGLDEVKIRSLAIDPKNPELIYAGTESKGVYRSSNAGRTWTAQSEFGLGKETFPPITAIGIDPQNTTNIYAYLEPWLFNTHPEQETTAAVPTVQPGEATSTAQTAAASPTVQVAGEKDILSDGKRSWHIQKVDRASSILTWVSNKLETVQAPDGSFYFVVYVDSTLTPSLDLPIQSGEVYISDSSGRKYMGFSGVWKEDVYALNFEPAPQDGRGFVLHFLDWPAIDLELWK